MSRLKVPLDIETIPGQPEEAIKAEIAKTVGPPASFKKAETIADWHAGEGKYAGEKDKAIEELYRKTSFNGGVGEICSIAWSFGVQDDDQIYSIGGGDMSEAELLEFFFNSVFATMNDNKERLAPYFIGHNIGNFDLKFLKHRAIVLGVKPPFAINPDGRHGSDYFCTMEEWCGYRDMVSMDNLCKYLGIEGKGDIDGSMVWDLVQARDFDTLDEYNRDDVTKVRKIYRRQTFGG